MRMIKRANPFYKVAENDIIITKHIDREILDKNELENTILDPRLDDSHGYIKLKPGMTLYNYFAAKTKIRNLLSFNVDPKYVENKFETFKINKDDYLRIPKRINRLFVLENGLKVLTKLQRAYNNIIEETSTIRSKDENIVYQNLYTQLLIEYNSLLSGKSGLFDRACNSLWPYSCRATITCSPNLKVNEISIPYGVLLSWVGEDKVREAFNIDKSLSNKEAVRNLENKRVMVGRQPSHDRSSLMSFIIKLKFNNGHSIKLNPAIIHLFDGDYDGDQVYCILPINKESQYDLINMDIFTFIRNNPSHFRPGKEFKKYKPSNWATDDYDKLNQQINNVCKESTNGQSVSYHDCFDDGRNDGYFDKLNINIEELKRIACGIYIDELTSMESEFGITNAIQSYKLIKQNVAQFGALTNAFVALAIHHTWNFDFNDKQKFLDIVTEFKHILCQDGLSAKHGNNRLNAKIGRTLQDMFYNSPNNILKTKEEYEKILKDINLSDEIIKTVMGLFWNEEKIIGVNFILNKCVPTYRITRRNTNIGLFEEMINIENENSIQSMMLF